MESTYFCDNCRKGRKITITENSQQPVKNGLIIETDLHRCENNQLQVYNIYIDGDYNARTIEHVEIPEFKKEKRSILGNLPTPGKLKNEKKEIKTLLISGLNSHPGLRILMTDAVARYRLNIGNIKLTSEEPQFSVYSFLNTIELHYYPSIISPNENVKIWLQEFINIIERLPRNHLGNYIDGLRYVQGICTIEPEPNDLKILEMMLTSSEISIQILKEFDPTDFMAQEGGSQFESKTLTKLFKLLSRIEAKPNLTVSDLAINYEDDMIYLCNKLLILEQTGQIEIQRPESFDLEALLAEG